MHTEALTKKMKDTPKTIPANEESFEKLFLESIENQKEIREGAVVSGTIMKLGPDFVTIDIGYKSEGRIHFSEFFHIKI